MLTVWCVCVGTKYTDADVKILQRMVDRHTEQPYHFRCLADRQINAIDTCITQVDWPGWWQKLNLFNVSEGQCLYLDLDTVVVGNLDRLLCETLSTPANWAQSGHGGCQSSVMSWGDDYSDIARRFDPAQLSAPERGNCGSYGHNKLWGDQEFITEVMGSPGHYIFPMKHVYSYKYHSRNGPPEDASVVAFHGEPKPAQVNDSWILAARSSTPIAA